MSEKELAAKLAELKEYQRLAEEAAEAAENLKDQIKAYMGESETLVAGAFKVTWKAVQTSRVDTAAMKKAMPEVVEAFTRTTTTRRFTVA